MKKVIALFLILLISIPFFAISASAAEYDLGDPFDFGYITPAYTGPDSWPWASKYSYHPDDYSISFGYSGIGVKSYFAYYDNYRQFQNYNPNWSFGTYIEPHEVERAIRVSGFNESNPMLIFATTESVRNNLYFRGIAYENLYLPSVGQYFKVSFSVDSALIQAPDAILNYVNLKNLCYLCDTSGVPGYAGRYSLPKVYPSTATLAKEGNVYKFTYFFNLKGEDFTALADSDNICLGLRIPYYFNNTSSFDGGVRIISNANIPTTYEIITVGGYDQIFEDIESSITNYGNTMLNTLTNVSDSDFVHIIEFEQDNVQLDNTINDYKDSEAKIEDIDNSIVLPPLNDTFNDNVLADLQLPDFGNLSILWNDLITEMLIVVLTLGTFAVILYGKRI